MASVFRHTVLALVTTACVAGAGWVHAQAAKSKPPAEAAARPPAPTPSELMAEFHRLFQQKRLTELRTTYNGDYGTSLLLVDQDTVAYLTLSYRKELWRVYKFASTAPAENAYDTLARQTRAWAADDLRRAVAAGQKARLEREAQAADQHATALGQDLRVIQAQRQKMLAEQQIMRQQTQALDAEHRAYQAQIESLQQQIRLLEQQLNDPTGMPAP